ncbi:MAG: helix-turn-helix domain-containing protein [Puniceicoccaceae bacterium]
MDNLIKHWASNQRLFPSQLPIQSIGYIRGKTDYLQATFQTLNFSIILRGGGEYVLNGERWPVEAPCILMEFPDVYCEYGPTAPYSSWDELYLIYDPSAFPLFEQMRMADLSRPVWSIHSADWLTQRLAEINRQLGRRNQHGRADWLDRTLQAFLLETLLTLEPPEPTHSEQVLQATALRIQENLLQPVDWSNIARKCGMSLPTLRRQWKHKFQVPPGTYLTQLRLSEAKRLLVETTLPVGEIASRIGIDDALYFSRLFRKDTGQSPSTYRQTFRMRSQRGE